MSNIKDDIEQLERKLIDLKKLYERDYKNYLQESKDLRELLNQASVVRNTLENQLSSIEPEKLDVILKLCELMDTNRRY